jgi:hypothetical protein
MNTIEKAKFTNEQNNGVGVLTAASAGTLGADTNGVAIYTANNNGGRVESLMISTDDTAAVNCFIYILNGSSVKPLGIVNVPLNSGNSGSVNNVDALRGASITLQGLPIDVTGKPYIPLMPNEVLKFSCLANMTAGKKCYATALGADFSISPSA